MAAWVLLAVGSAITTMWLLVGYRTGRLAIMNRTVLRREDQPIAFAFAMAANLMFGTAIPLFVVLAMQAQA